MKSRAIGIAFIIGFVLVVSFLPLSTAQAKKCYDASNNEIPCYDSNYYQTQQAKRANPPTIPPAPRTNTPSPTPTDTATPTPANTSTAEQPSATASPAAQSAYPSPAPAAGGGNGSAPTPQTASNVSLILPLLFGGGGLLAGFLIGLLVGVYVIRRA